MSHSFTNLLSHVVFGTKNGAGCIDAEIRPRLHAYLGGIVRELSGIALSVNGPSDHVHLLVKLPATACLADAMRVIKTNSSRWVHETWHGKSDFAWQTGYGAFSVSQSGHKAVMDYIAGQESHHRRMTFREEFVALLKRHGIEYDERYVFE